MADTQTPRHAVPADAFGSASSPAWLLSRVHAKFSAAKDRLQRKLIHDNAQRKLRRVVNLIRLKRSSIHIAEGTHEQLRYKLDSQTAVTLNTLQRITNYLTRHGLSAAELFQRLDGDGNGTLTVAEFRAGLRDLGLMFEDAVITITMQSIDEDCDGVINCDEFRDKMKEMLDAAATLPNGILSGLCNHLRETGQSVHTLCERLDVDGSGHVSFDALYAKLQQLGLRATKFAIKAAVDELDLNGNLVLEVSELVKSLEDFQRSMRIFANTVLGSICDYVERTRSSVVQLFAGMDSDGSGALDSLEMQEALRCIGIELDELDVRDVMAELAGAQIKLTPLQFMDRLVLYKNNRVQDAARLFAQFDSDGTGELDRQEIYNLAIAMGLEPLLEDPTSELTVDKLIEDIESSRDDDLGSEDGHEEGGDGVDEERDNLVSNDEFQAWYNTVGRSYMPAPEHLLVEEVDCPTEEELRELFATVDDDDSGEVGLEEVKAASLARWPNLDMSLIEQAFATADMDGSGVVTFDEFDELVQCMQFLNHNRHMIRELLDQFSEGVGREEFQMGIAALGIVVSDSLAFSCFDVECVKHNKDIISPDDFILWVCRYECIDGVADQLMEQATLANAAAELQAEMSEFGDVYFEDLAKVMYVSKHHSRKKSHTENAVLSRMHRAKSEAVQRFRCMRDGVKRATELRETFPEIPNDVIRDLVMWCETKVYYSGQNFITQGMEEDCFFVIRRGKADLIIDGEKLKSFVAGDPLGEICLMYSSRRSASVRAAGPCEVLALNRAAYDTCMGLLPEEHRIGPLIKIQQKFWDLCTGPDGSNKQEVDYSVYLKYHLCVAKTLTSQSDMDDYDEDDAREIAQEDWAEDTKRFDQKITGALTLPMFFDSILQMCDLWAGDLSLSFVGFLTIIFDNIATWQPDAENPEQGCWVFKSLDEVGSRNDEVQAIQDEARQKQDAERQAKAAADAEAERRRMEQENLERERRQAMRLAQEERERLQNRSQFAKQLDDRLAALAREEALVRRKLTDAVVTKADEESLRRRLSEFPVARNEILIDMLEYDEAELIRCLNCGEVNSEQMEEAYRRELAGCTQTKLQLRMELLAPEKAEIERRLATVLDRSSLVSMDKKLSSDDEQNLQRQMKLTDEVNNLEQRLLEIETQDLKLLQITTLDAEVEELNRRLKSGSLSTAEEQVARKRIPEVVTERRSLLDELVKRITHGKALRLLEKTRGQFKCSRSSAEDGSYLIGHSRTNCPRAADGSYLLSNVASTLLATEGVLAATKTEYLMDYYQRLAGGSISDAPIADQAEQVRAALDCQGGLEGSSNAGFKSSAAAAASEDVGTKASNTASIKLGVLLTFAELQ